MHLQKLTREQLIPKRDWRKVNYWRAKGKPSYIGKIETPCGSKVELFAWNKISKSKIETLRKCIYLLPSELVLPTKYLLFDIKDAPNPYSLSELCTGYRRQFEMSIQFYPYSYITKGYYKGLSKVPIWQGTIIHEFAHNQDFYPEIMNAWIKEFGWVKIDKPRIIYTSNKFRIKVEYKCIKKEMLVTKYAGYKPEEDFAESMVAALLCPERLNRKKFMFIQRIFKI